MRVLDVGCGTGNATLPAAAAGADVVATDVTAELLAIGERHARDRGLTVRWEVADAQALPFADGEFDAVLSCIGAIFAPDQAATARELLRVCRPGGIVVMANWTPDGGVGPVLRVAGPLRATGRRRRAARPGVGRAGARHRPARRRRRADRAAAASPRVHRLRPTELAAYYRRHFPPVVAVMADLDDVRADRLERELADLYAAKNTAPPGGPPSYELEYLLVRARVPASDSAPCTSTRGSAESRRASSSCASRCTRCCVCLHAGVDQTAQPVGDAAQLADGGVVDPRLRRADHRDPGGLAVVHPARRRS